MSGRRARWAAIGAAVAITLGGGGIGLVAATDPADAVTFVPVTACRVVDTRPGFQVGARSTPLGADETLVVDATGGDAGECPNVVPAGATSLSLNVTAVDATSGTFLAIWETGQTMPNASSLNPAPNQPPTPNAVTTGINAGGEFNIYNLLGTVHVFADINGYFIDHDHPHDHDDRYYSESEVDDLINSIPGAGQKSVMLHPTGWAFDEGAYWGRGVTPQRGVHLPPAGGSDQAHARFSITLPSDFTTGAEPVLELYWRISTTTCTVNLNLDATDGARLRQTNLAVGEDDIPDVIIGTPGAYEVRRLRLRLFSSGDGLRANDVIEFLVYRAADACNADAIIEGGHLRYD